MCILTDARTLANCSNMHECKSSWYSLCFKANCAQDFAAWMLALSFDNRLVNWSRASKASMVEPCCHNELEELGSVKAQPDGSQALMRVDGVAVVKLGNGPNKFAPRLSRFCQGPSFEGAFGFYSIVRLAPHLRAWLKIWILCIYIAH